jgi:hypothetical protein
MPPIDLANMKALTVNLSDVNLTLTVNKFKGENGLEMRGLLLTCGKFISD